jgi:hypothetical protein
MGPFTIEQLTYQHSRDLQERAAREAFVKSHKGANGGRSTLRSWLSAHLPGRRDAARPLALVVPLGSARRNDTVSPEREAS